MVERRWRRLACLVLVLATLAAFGELRNHQFVNIDDDIYVTTNPAVQGGLSLQGIVWAFTTTHAGFWHPLTWLSHMLDCQLFGLHPGSHHLMNLVFHLANTLLLFFFFLRTTQALEASFLVAALFAWHPLHVESVAWVAERKDVLSTFFWLLTMWAYGWYVESPGLKRYLLMAACLSLGLMAKPMVVTLPLVLLLLDYWPLGRWPRHPSPEAGPARKSRERPREEGVPLKRLVLEKVPLLVLAGLLSAVTFYAQREAGAMAPLMGSFTARLSNALVAYVTYLGKALWPVHLAVFYPHPETSLPLWQGVGAGLMLAFLSLLVIWKNRQYPYLLVGWLWFLGTLVPVIGLVQVGDQALADRFTYVPLIGLFIMGAWGLMDLAARWRAARVPLGAAAGVVLLALLACTWLQTRHWRDSISLFTHALEATPNNYFAHNNLGVALAAQGKMDQAVEQYQEALWLRPHYARAHYNLGNALFSQRKVSQAVSQYEEALRLRPNFAMAHYTLGNALLSQGQVEQAAAHYQEALRLQPGHAMAHNNLGAAFFSQGKPAEAIPHYLEALRLEPRNAMAHGNLGVALAVQGQLDQAVAHFYEALRLQPGHAEMHFNLGKALLLQGNTEQAISQHREALRLKPHYPQALDGLARILATAGDQKFRDGAAAVPMAERANQLTGYGQPEMLDTLAAAYAEVGRFPEAVEASQKALDLAQAQGLAQLAGVIKTRLRQYRAGQPYHETIAPREGEAG